jgi:hypothetical protein
MYTAISMSMTAPIAKKKLQMSFHRQKSVMYISMLIITMMITTIMENIPMHIVISMFIPMMGSGFREISAK